MSLYNMLNGYDSTAEAALKMLDLTADDTGRFRDAWIEEDGKHISIYTRNGGGNRESYEEVTEMLSGHPNYIEDFDDDFDCTYATYRFTVPDKYTKLAKDLKPAKKQLSLKEKIDAAIEALSNKGGLE